MNYVSLSTLAAGAAGFYMVQVPADPSSLQATAERLTLISGLCFAVVAFLFEWVMPGKTAQKRIDAATAKAEADVTTARRERDEGVALANKLASERVATTIAAYQKTMDDMRADFDRQIASLAAEIKRLQTNELEWQRITLNTLSELDRSGRVLERGIVQPLESQSQSGQRLLGPKRE